MSLGDTISTNKRTKNEIKRNEINAFCLLMSLNHIEILMFESKAMHLVLPTI